MNGLPRTGSSRHKRFWSHETSGARNHGLPEAPPRHRATGIRTNISSSHDGGNELPRRGSAYGYHGRAGPKALPDPEQAGSCHNSGCATNAATSVWAQVLKCGTLCPIPANRSQRAFGPIRSVTRRRSSGVLLGSNCPARTRVGTVVSCGTSGSGSGADQAAQTPGGKARDQANSHPALPARASAGGPGSRLRGTHPRCRSAWHRPAGWLESSRRVPG